MRTSLYTFLLAGLVLSAPMVAFAQEPDAPSAETSEDADPSAEQEEPDSKESPDVNTEEVESPPGAARRGTDTKSGSESTFRVVYTPPGCLDSTGSTAFGLGEALERHFEINNGQIDRTSYGPAALSNGPETLVPESSANDAALVSELAEAGELEWTVVEEDFPALVSPWETMIQIPFRGHFDWLSIVESQTGDDGAFPDTERVMGTLSRASLPSGGTLLRLELPERPQDPIFVRQTMTTYRIDAPDDSVRIVSVGASLGRGSRLKPRILDRLAAPGSGSSIVLHPGDVTSADASEEERMLCGQAARSLNPMAIVPRSGELSLGPVGLANYAGAHTLRYVAANLVDRRSDERPFRRFSILNLDGLTIAVIGIVGRDQLLRLPRATRDAWRLTDPDTALQEARRDLETQLQRRPDLTIVLLATADGAAYSRVSSVPEVDIVIGPFDRADIVPFEEEIRVAPGAFRRRRASVRTGGNPFAVGDILATFAIDGDATRPVEFEHKVFPVLDEGEIDADLHRAFLPIEEEFARRWSRPILPELQPIFEAAPGLTELAKTTDEPKFGFSDPIWYRLMANEVRRGFSADVAIVAEHPRKRPLAGAITQGQLAQWLDDTSQIRVVLLTGAELQAIAEYAASPAAAGETPIEFAGYDPEKGLVEGRPIREGLPYRVALTDDVADRDALDAIFAGKSSQRRFITEGTRWEASDEGEAVTVERAVLHSLGDDLVSAPELRGRLTDVAEVRDHQWRLHLRSLSVRAHSATNFGDQDFGETRETSVRVPDDLELGYRLDALLAYDGPLLGWDLGAFAQFDRLEFGDPESTFEPYDELLFYTEARANRFGFEIGDAGFPLIPSLRLAYDTEATALPDATDPGSDLSRQQLFRIVPSLVAFPGDFLRRVDLGPVVQLDLVDGRADAGLEASYRLVFPLIGALDFESATTLRYLFADGSDDAADLALRLDSRNALTHPLVGGFGIAVYADLYLVQGKTDPNDGVGGLFTAGASLRYRGSLRF